MAIYGDGKHNDETVWSDDLFDEDFNEEDVEALVVNMKHHNEVQAILNIVKTAFDKHIEVEGFLDDCRDPQAYLCGEESFFTELYTELTKRENKV